MKKRWMMACMTGVVAGMLLTGCGSNKEAEGISPSPTIKVEEELTPTAEPTAEPTVEPTTEPTAEPAVEPTTEPTAEPTTEPTAEPTTEPTVEPTTEPAVEPTTEPTAEPTTEPTEAAPAEEAEVVLGQYKGLELKEVDSAEVAEYLHAMLEANFAELKAVDRAAKEGDTVNINYIGKKDGVAFEGGTDDSEEGTDLELGSGSFIDGFEEGLVGAVAGEVRDLNLTFPEEYHSAELAGQSVVFTVTVNEVKESTVPELTDEFVKENIGYDTTAELVLVIDAMMNEQSFREQAILALVENSEVLTYPAARLEEEKQYTIDSVMNQAQIYMMYFGMDETSVLNMFGFQSTEDLKAYAEAYAYETVGQMLILEEIAKTEQLEPEEEYYQKKALEYATDAGYEDLESFEADYGREMIEEVVLLDYVVDYVISQAVIVKAENDGNIQQVE